MGVLAQLAGSGQLAEVGPGVWDIHSPRVPSAPEMADLIEQALQALPADRLWVNPDCGLKTRSWGRDPARPGQHGHRRPLRPGAEFVPAR